MSWVERLAQTGAYFNANWNPHAAEQTQEWFSQRRNILEKLADEGKSVVRAANSTDPVFQGAQAVVDDLVHNSRGTINGYYGAERLPEKIQLYVHQNPAKEFALHGMNYYQDIHQGMDAAYNRDIVETHHARFPVSLHDGSWKYASAHEIGHVVNQDVDPLHQIERLKKPLSHQMEIEADLMATILHGDIKGQQNWRASLPDFKTTIAQPNNSLRAKYLERWGSWLEKQGIAKEGKIIERAKALEVFPKAFKLLKQGIHQASHLHI